MTVCLLLPFQKPAYFLVDFLAVACIQNGHRDNVILDYVDDPVISNTDSPVSGERISQFRANLLWVMAKSVYCLLYSCKNDWVCVPYRSEATKSCWCNYNFVFHIREGPGRLFGQLCFCVFPGDGLAFLYFIL